MPTTDSSEDIARVYRFLSQAMQYPDDDWMTEDFFNVFYNLLGTLGAVDDAVLIKKVIKESNNPIEDLQVEYTRLFINGIPYVIAPPYGSVYMDKSFQGKFAGDTLAFYRNKGFGMEENADLPDNLIHELEFLSLLAESGDSEGEEDFLNKLFRPWFSQFKVRVSDKTQHPYYGVLVQLIDFFTKEENEDGLQLNKA